jgi:hypothetical protein
MDEDAVISPLGKAGEMFFSVYLPVTAYLQA